jgi:hypothetical protein
MLVQENARSEVFERLITGHRADFVDFQKRQHTRLLPYLAAIKNAVQDLSLGAKFQPAVQGLLKLPSAQRCYLIGSDGLQIGANVEAESKVHVLDQRFEVVKPTEGTDWQTKPYFRRAIETPDKCESRGLTFRSRAQAVRDAVVRLRSVGRRPAGPVRRSGFRLARWRGYRLRREQPARLIESAAASAAVGGRCFNNKEER